MKRCLLTPLLLLSTAVTASALDADERTLFGLTSLASTHPGLTGKGYSVGISDTEFDVTHPGLGWTGGDEYDLWFYSRQYIPRLNRINPRIAMSGHRMSTAFGYTNYHGVEWYSFTLPITQNNTLMTNWWFQHGTAVAGTAAGGLAGPEGHSLGAAHQAKLVLAGDTDGWTHLLSMVPDGNPDRTVAMNRSFTGSSFVEAEARRNSGVIGVNSAGNSFSAESDTRMNTGGNSPQFASIRWLEDVGYDLIASGLSVQSATDAHASAYGSQRNQESIFTDYTVRTIRPDGYFDSYASGTSFSGPLLAGGVTLVQQAYETSHPGRWLSVAQMNRILKKSANFVDDPYTGIRYPVANFAAAVAMAETYDGDPSFEPNFSTTFPREARLTSSAIVATNYFLNPLFFRVSTFYTPGHYTNYTTPRVDGTQMVVRGHTGGNDVNVALRNGWGDLAVVNLNEPGKNLTTSFRFDLNAGGTSGNRGEFFIGIKEMVGSAQFMDAGRQHDNTDRGRLAFRITYTRNDSSARIDLLQCSQNPVIDLFGNEPIWQRSDYYATPEWDTTPLATAYVNNLHNETRPVVETSFTSSRAMLKINGTTIIDAAHFAPLISLTRATPYLHFRNLGPDVEQRLSSFSAITTSGAKPVIYLDTVRKRAIEGVNGPTAAGHLRVRRTTAISQPLNVYYTVGGNAINGQDFTQLSGAVTIPANVASADIFIRPLNDTTPEGIEGVIVALAPNAAYIISDTDASKPVSIVDYADIDGDGIMSWDEDSNRNGNLADDDANGNLLPNYLDTLDRVPTNNIAPVANAGPAKTTIGVNAVYVDGTQSSDADGFIDSFAWSIVPGPNNGPVVLEDAASSLARVRWTAPSASNRVVSIVLTVTDNHGAFSSSTTTVTQLAGQVFNKTYPQVYFRGSPNGWGTTPMILVTNYTWEHSVFVSGGGSQNFKFDVYGDWSLNFGNNNNDGYADQGGGNIAFTQGDGQYRIRFNDQTRAFSVEKVVPNVPPFVNAGADVTTYQMEPVTLSATNSYDVDGYLASYLWTIVEGGDGPLMITNTTTATPTLQWHAPAVSSRVARVRLIVTDDDGAASSATVTVTQVSTISLNKTYPQVYFRGTPNGWGTQLMNLVSNYTWEATVEVGSGAQNFKFDIHGNWSLNFGDNHNDGIAEQNGGNMSFSQGAGTYIVRFNDQTKRYWLIKQVVNVLPVVNAGPNQTLNSLSGATVYLDGSGSHDPDGSIIEYAWTQSSGPFAIISYASPGSPNATVVLLSQTSNTTYTFSLRVTDNSGAMATGTVSITQQAGGFNKIHPQVYLRGTANNWGTSIMTLVSNHVWEIEATFGGTANERFKLDVYGDWSLNFGDNQNDGITEQSGGDIIVGAGAGTYRIRFNDLTRAYTVAKIGGTFARDFTSMSVAGTMNNWNPAANNLQVIADYTWSGTFVLSGDVQLKFAANSAWGSNWGENDQPGTSAPLNGYLESNGGNVRLIGLAGATYRITMNERTRAYSVTRLAGSEAGPERLLVGWEARYAIDLLGTGTADADQDLDGLSNLAEYHLGTDPYQRDSDTDGATDFEEVIAATDPVDGTSVLEAIPTLRDGALRIEWMAKADRVYRVEANRTLNATSEWLDLSGLISPDGKVGPMSFAPVDGYNFYRVRVGPPGLIGTTGE